MVALVVGSFSLLTVLVSGIVIFLLMQCGVIEKISQNISVTWILIIAFITNYLVTLLMVVFLNEITSKPIRFLTEKMNELTSGNYRVRITLSRTLRRYASIRELSESFNTLAEELDNTEMLRGDFINNFSHEFKTPIVSIAGFAKLLKRGNLTEEQKIEYLNIIEEESLRLSTMATNVLNLTKVENQSILTDVTKFNLSEQLRKCVLLSEGKWSKKNIEFELEFEEYMIDANEELLKQVWINLIDNAIKFSPENSSIALQIKEKEEEIEVFVSNTGGGIDEEQKKKIFNKFYQGDESHASEGNGIGLALVKCVVELHRGKIDVRSDEKMTTFVVKLPKNEKSFVSV